MSSHAVCIPSHRCYSVLLLTIKLNTVTNQKTQCNKVMTENKSAHLSCHQIQCIPLATEPGISLIILTPMKILQRNLNRSMFVVWEMKRNVSVVRLIVATRSRGAEMPGSVVSGTHGTFYISTLKHQFQSQPYVIHTLCSHNAKVPSNYATLLQTFMC